MSNQSELKSAMQSLGFTKYEITIMLKLYNNGSSKADDLKGKEIPLSRAYDALDILIRKGFVASSSGRPRIYTAVNPQTAVNSLLKIEQSKQKEAIDSYSSIASTFLDHAQTLYFDRHTEIKPDDLMIQLTTLGEAEAKTKQIIRSAKNNIIIFTHVFNWFDNVKSDIKDALLRGCSVKILFQSEIDDVIITQLNELGVEYKVLKTIQIYSRGTIIDDKSVLFVIWVRDSPHGDKMIYRPQFSTNRGIVEIFKHAFENLWKP